jgi:hypothetical protein
MAGPQLKSFQARLLKQVKTYLDDKLEIPPDQILALCTLDPDFLPHEGGDSDIALRQKTLIESVCGDCRKDRASTRTLRAVQQDENTVVGSSIIATRSNYPNVYQPQGEPHNKTIYSVLSLM